MSFVLASPLLNPIILSMFLALLGWKACLRYGLVTFIMSMVAGGVLQGLGLAKDVKNVRISGGPQEREKLPSFKKKSRRAFDGALADFRSVLIFLVIGVAIGAVVYG